MAKAEAKWKKKVDAKRETSKKKGKGTRDCFVCGKVAILQRIVVTGSMGQLQQEILLTWRIGVWILELPNI